MLNHFKELDGSFFKVSKFNIILTAVLNLLFLIFSRWDYTVLLGSILGLFITTVFYYFRNDKNTSKTPRAILYQPNGLKSYFLTKPIKNLMAKTETTKDVIMPTIKTVISFEVIIASAFNMYFNIFLIYSLISYLLSLLSPKSTPRLLCILQFHDQ